MTEHAQWRKPNLKARRDATNASVVKGVDAGISAWIAEAGNRVSGQELTGEEDELHRALVSPAE